MSLFPHFSPSSIFIIYRLFRLRAFPGALRFIPRTCTDLRFLLHVRKFLTITLISRFLRALSLSSGTLYNLNIGDLMPNPEVSEIVSFNSFILNHVWDLPFVFQSLIVLLPCYFKLFDSSCIFHFSIDRLHLPVSYDFFNDAYSDAS